MANENISWEFRLKEIDKARDYFIEEIKENELTSKKHKKVCDILNYIEHSLILAFTLIGWVSISALASLIGIPVGISNSVVTIKTSVTKYKSIIKENETL